MAHDVFISHATGDKTVADAVCSALETAGIRCWIAPRDVQPGRSFAGEITRGIQNSKAIVLIFSAHSNNSEQVLREVQLATNSHLHIVQFRIEDVILNDDLKYFLSTPHWLDALSPPLEKHLRGLTASIQALLGAPMKEAAEIVVTPPASTARQPRGHRLWFLAGICFFWTVLVLGLHFTPNVPLLSAVWWSQQGFEDLLRREGRKTATRPDFVFLGIDARSLAFQSDKPQSANNRALQLMAERPFPWSREVWALLLDRLFQAGARLVIFDVIFSSTNDGDPAFRAALDRYRDKVVIGANLDFSNVRETGAIAVPVPPDASLIPPPQLEDDRVGYVVFFPDSLDQKIRSARYTMTDLQLRRQLPNPNEKQYESLSARALAKLGRADAVPRDLSSHLIRFSASDAYPVHPLWEVFDPNMWHLKYEDGASFKDTIVVLGISADFARDLVDTPISPELPGPVLHLHALAAALDHEFLYDTPLWLDFTAITVAGFLAWALIARIRRPTRLIMTLVGAGVGYLLLALLLYNLWGVLIMVVPTLTAFLLGGVFGLATDYVILRVSTRTT